MPRTLITGGAGFLGSHLCDRFLAEGHEVVCMDNLITGNPDNVAHLIGNERFEFVQHDVTNFVYVAGDARLRPPLRQPGAARSTTSSCPIQTLKVGALGTHNALGLAKAKGARFLLASHQRGLRRPAGPPAAGDLLGQRQPGRPARRLRRGQALRRGHDDGLPPLPRRRHAHRPHLQHLRPADAARRRPRAARRSWARRSAASPSPSSATARRRARSATWTTSSRASTAC